jgi:hypothetical protein
MSSSRMGLDATVYCDCYEAGRLSSQPDPAWEIYVDTSGRRECRATEMDVLVAFEDWHRTACSHSGGMLVHEYLGNIARIGLVVEGLSREPDSFPTILTKVLYSSTHAVDQLSAEDAEQIARELPRAATLQLSDAPRVEAAVAYFCIQMDRLLHASRTTGKPIYF